jgi:hypothetical protein
MKDDAARQHWEDHELVMSKQHIAARRALAEKRIRNRRGLSTDADIPMHIVDEEVAVMEEEMFRFWYENKKAGGFDQFPIDTFDPDED